MMRSMLPIAVLLAGASAQPDPFALPNATAAPVSGAATASPRPANFRPSGTAGLPHAIPDACAPRLSSRERRLACLRAAISLDSGKLGNPAAIKNATSGLSGCYIQQVPFAAQTRAAALLFVCVRWSCGSHSVSTQIYGKNMCWMKKEDFFSDSPSNNDEVRGWSRSTCRPLPHMTAHNCAELHTEQPDAHTVGAAWCVGKQSG